MRFFFTGAIQMTEQEIRLRPYYMEDENFLHGVFSALKFSEPCMLKKLAFPKSRSNNFHSNKPLVTAAAIADFSN